MSTTWILVASRDEARVFSRQGAELTLTLEIDVGNPAGRLKNSDIDSDRAGRSTDNRMHARHAYSSEVEPRDHLLHAFYTETLNTLRLAYIQGRFDDLVVVAEPRLLGVIRQRLPEMLREVVTREIPKDLSFASPQQLATRVQR
jgi:protein required for attachment to host cells